jgi:tetratricopeptide (TPR) repeat protein
MLSPRRSASALLLAMAFTLGAAPAFTAHAQTSEEQEAEDRRRSRQTLSARTGQALNEALNFANEEPPRTQEALQVVDRLLSRELPPYDRATALEVRGGLRASLDNMPGALQDYTEILRLDVLPSTRQRQIRRNVAQLYYVTEQYDQAIRFMQDYIRQVGAEAEANDYFILSASHVQKNDFRSARSPAETAIRLDQQAGERNKQFYDLLNLIYNELGLETERGQLLETMVEYFPSEESYWVQLASAYSAADRRADALAALEVAYKAGLIEGEDKIVTLAQFYYDQNNPYRGAQLLESEMNAGNVERDLSNLELLAQLWAASREQDNAIEILTEAAPKRDDGRLYYQLGQSYMADEKYQLAIRNLREAIRRGGLDRREIGNAYVLIGTALFQRDSDSEESRQAARSEFVRASNYEGARSTSASWVEYIDTIEETLERQAEVEFSQAVERQSRQIDRCESLLDVIELGGRTDVPADEIQSCRDLVRRVETEGLSAEDLVRERQAAAEAEDGEEG